MERQELNTSSMAAHARSAYLADVKSRNEKWPGTEMHGESAEGKLVVVLETLNQGYITDIIDKIDKFEHVLSTALVYHQIEQLEPSESDKL